MKAKSAKLGDVGVYAYVRARGGVHLRGRKSAASGGVGGEWRVGKKEGMFLRKVGRCWRKVDLFLSKELPFQLESRKYFAKLIARLNENAYL